MDLRIIERNGKEILQYLTDDKGNKIWKDIPKIKEDRLFSVDQEWETRGGQRARIIYNFLDKDFSSLYKLEKPIIALVWGAENSLILVAYDTNGYAGKEGINDLDLFKLYSPEEE